MAELAGDVQVGLFAMAVGTGLQLAGFVDASLSGRVGTGWAAGRGVGPRDELMPLPGILALLATAD